MFQQLMSEKFNPTFWASLSVREALAYDYKQFETAGFPFGAASVLLPIAGAFPTACADRRPCFLFGETSSLYPCCQTSCAMVLLRLKA